MRSFAPLAVLAAIGNLHLSSATPCKLTSSILSTTTNPSSSSSTISSSHPDTAPSTTTTQSSSAPTSTGVTVAIRPKNRITNGGFTDVGDGTGIPNYTGSSPSIDRTNGFRGDGSKDANCAKLTSGSNSVVTKRDSVSSYLSQQIDDLEAESAYTVRFSVTLVSTSSVTCAVQASLGSQFFSQDITPGSAIDWATYTKQVTVHSSSESLTFSFTCPSDALVTIYMDSIFVSDKVTPENIDDATLDWGDEVNTAVISTTIGGQTTTVSPTTTSPTTAAFSRPVTRTRLEGTMTPSATCPGAVTPTPLATCVSRTPAPTSLTCGVLGVKAWDWWGYAPFVTKSQKSVEDCALLCYQDALNCNAFAYIPDYSGRSICAFGYYSLAQDGLTPGEAPTAYTWYDRDCYECEACAS